MTTQRRLKVCARCKVSKRATLAEFYGHAQCKDGIGPYCRPCHNAHTNDWKRKNSGAVAARRREQYKQRWGAINRANEERRAALYPLRVSAERLTNGIRERAKLRGFDIDPQLRRKHFVIEWLQKQPCCECCGVEFNHGKKNGIANDNSPSFDRVDTGLGYLLSNVALVCWRCNNIKRNYIASDLRRVADWLEGRIVPSGSIAKSEVA